MQAPSIERAIDKVTDKLQGWYESFVELLPNLAVATVVMVLFYLAAKMLARALRRGLETFVSSREIASLLITTLHVAIVSAGFFVALGILGLEKTVTSLLAGVGILGLALGFAFQDLAANFMSGIILAIKRPFKVGDVIESNDIVATVEEIDLRATIVRTFSGQLVHVPNKEIMQNPITNFTASGRRRVEIPVGVSYADDLRKVEQVAVAAIETIESRDHDTPVQVLFKEFGDSSINFDVWFWVAGDNLAEYLAARSQAIIAIKQAFDEASLSIPFPIRTLDFSDVGGKPLDQVLPKRSNHEQPKDSSSSAPYTARNRPME